MSPRFGAPINPTSQKLGFIRLYPLLATELLAPASDGVFS